MFLYLSHLPGRVISGPKNLIFLSLSLNHHDFSAIWHLGRQFGILKKIRPLIFIYFSYEEIPKYLNLQNAAYFYIFRGRFNQNDKYEGINKENTIR